MTFSASTNNWARNGGTAPLKLPDQSGAAPAVEAAVDEAVAAPAEEAEKPQ
ncbi:MAG: hypothetical protein JWM80_3373 [Cyanobacteria bacterium RYN_339]|nr:hypothetical protein [Cyanobacteria bacterium RYN_339]